MSRITQVCPESVNAESTSGTGTARSQKRRVLLKAGGTLLLSVLAPAANAAQILAVRVWPAEDYTRVTLENDSELKTNHFVLKDPYRLFVDIEGLELNAKLKELVAKIKSNDPYIKQVRVGQNRPNVVRLVFDLKEEVSPQVFTLPPVGNYKHRLVFDLYPSNPTDPLAALIEKGEWNKEPGAITQAPVATANPADILAGKSEPKLEPKPEVKLDPQPEIKPGAPAIEKQENRYN